VATRSPTRSRRSTSRFAEIALAITSPYTNRNTFVSPHFNGQPPFGNLSTPGFAVGGRASQGAAAIPLSTAENCVYALENCRVGFGNLIVISLLSASDRAGRQRKSGACCACRQRTGSGIQGHGLRHRLGLLKPTCRGAVCLN
jgi:hypothetical protein